MKNTLRVQLKGRLEDLKGKIREIASVIFGRSTPEGTRKGHGAGQAGKAHGK
jgi:hypothetical protein